MPHPPPPASDPGSGTGPRTLAELLPEREFVSRYTEEDLAEMDRQAEQRRRRELLDKLARQAGGARYAGHRFSNWSAEDPLPRIAAFKARVKAAVREWADTFAQRQAERQGLVLYGPVGTGKDHLAFAALRQVVIQHGVSAAWRNGRDLMGEVRDRIDRQLAEREFIGGLAAPAVLVLSDPLPPTGELTAHQADVLYRIVEHRYSAGRITIATLNVAGDDEADRRLGPPTWDRLSHAAWRVFCQWATYRQPAREVRP